MGKLKITAAVLFALSAPAPLYAQYDGGPQDGFRSGQYSGQYGGQVWDQANSRVDGRGSHDAGLPPSAADRGRTFGIPIDPRDCAEVNSVAPDARPGWQIGVRSTCRDY